MAFTSLKFRFFFVIISISSNCMLDSMLKGKTFHSSYLMRDSTATSNTFRQHNELKAQKVLPSNVLPRWKVCFGGANIKWRF